MPETNTAKSDLHYVITRAGEPLPEWVGHLEDLANGGAEAFLLAYVRDNGAWHAEYTLAIEGLGGWSRGAYVWATDPAMFPWCVYWTPGENAVSHYTSIPYARFISKEAVLNSFVFSGLRGLPPMFTLVHSPATMLKCQEVREKAHPLTNDL